MARGTKRFLLAIAGGLFLLVFVLANIGGQRSGGNDQGSDTYVAIRLKDAAKQSILPLLKAPSTAQFSQDKFLDTETEIRFKQGTALYAVFGWVDSQNSFGAMLRSEYVVGLECHRAVENRP